MQRFAGSWILQPAMAGVFPLVQSNRSRTESSLAAKRLLEFGCVPGSGLTDMSVPSGGQWPAEGVASSQGGIVAGVGAVQLVVFW